MCPGAMPFRSVGNAGRDDAGFAGARARQDQHRSLQRFDGKRCCGLSEPRFGIERKVYPAQKSERKRLVLIRDFVRHPRAELKNEPMEQRALTLGHSPDPDDAFMFYALAKELIPTRGYRFDHVLQDIQTLNERATRGELDITAISIHAYAHVAGNYALLPSGASMGDG